MPFPPPVSEIVSGAPALAALEVPWRRFAGELPRGSLFSSFAWVKSWLAAFGADKELHALCAWRGAELAALLPLVESRIRRGPSLAVHHDIHPEDRRFLTRSGRLQVLPLRQWTVPGNLESGNMRAEPLLRPGDEGDALGALAAALAAAPGWDVVSLPALPEALAEAIARAAQARGLLVRRAAGRALYRSPVLPWAAFLRRRSVHYRDRFKTAQRKLAACGTLATQVAHRPEEGLRALEELFALAERSWKQEGRPGEAVHVPLTGRARAFYRDLVLGRRAEEPCPVVAVRVDGQLICAMLCAARGETLFALQTYHDPDFSLHSPGAQILPALFDWCAERGLAQVDWNGNSAYVQRVAETRDEYPALQIFRPRGYSRLLHWLAGVAAR
jgi:CelD/BcsL family acetyltransferase involved in cellulose biosynthesis